MAHMTASFADTVPSVSPIIEQNDLTKPPVTRYWLRFGVFDLYLNQAEVESLHRDLDCLLGDPDAHAQGRCAHSRGDLGHQRPA
jgi:hypothetical protein